jgi:hypothetical protein
MGQLEVFAEKELWLAGLMAEESDFDGGVGKAVLELVKVFAAQGHSGYSARMTIEAFQKVAKFEPLTPLKNPKFTGEYIVHENSDVITMQSTRRQSVFSEDGGKTWYDIDAPVPRWKRIFGHRRQYIKFAQ